MKDRQGNPIDHRRATVQQFMDTDTVFAGTPDDVFQQIKDFLKGEKESGRPLSTVEDLYRAIA